MNKWIIFQLKHSSDISSIQWHTYESVNIPFTKLECVEIYTDIAYMLAIILWSYIKIYLKITCIQLKKDIRHSKI